MKKDHLVSLISMAVLSSTIASAYADVTTEWINESRDYSVKESVGGWQVVEYKDAVAGNANSVWTVNGFPSGAVDANGSSIL